MSPLICFIALFAMASSNPVLIELTPDVIAVSGDAETRSEHVRQPEVDATAHLNVADLPMGDAAFPERDDSAGGVIDVLFAPEVTSIDVEDENKRHREEKKEEEKEEDKLPKDYNSGISEIENEAEIPAEFYQKILKMESIEEFVKETNIDVGFALRRFGAPEAKPSVGCVPKTTCVNLSPDKRHPSEGVFPVSIDVERCGGCCGHPDLQCLPYSTEAFTVKLLKYRYNVDGSLTSLGYEDKTVIRDLKCKCAKVQN